MRCAEWLQVYGGWGVRNGFREGVGGAPPPPLQGSKALASFLPNASAELSSACGERRLGEGGWGGDWGG